MRAQSLYNSFLLKPFTVKGFSDSRTLCYVYCFFIYRLESLTGADYSVHMRWIY